LLLVVLAWRSRAAGLYAGGGELSR